MMMTLMMKVKALPSVDDSLAYGFHGIINRIIYEPAVPETVA